MENRSAEILNLNLHVYSIRNLAPILNTCCVISISSSKAAILDFRLPLAPHHIVYGFFVFLDQENMGRAVEIMQLSCIQTELFSFLKFFKK